MTRFSSLSALACLAVLAGCGTDDTADDTDSGSLADTSGDAAGADASGDSGAADGAGADVTDAGDASDASGGDSTTGDSGDDTGDLDTGVDADPGDTGPSDALGDTGEDTSNGCVPGGLAVCDDGWFCASEAGACDSLEGACAPIPVVCSEVFAPVCGCDGTTYANECEAASAQVSVDHAGECAAATTCSSNSDCSGDEFCNSAALDCNIDGACEPKPMFCPFVFLPVCGCDGVTYDNACMANSFGVRAAADGECDAAPVCTKSSDCAESEYCDVEPGGCGATEGRCALRPMLCPDLYSPVCSCDGVTYSNECEAAAAGADISSTDACPM